MWESQANPPALGAGERRFESGHPDSGPDRVRREGGSGPWTVSNASSQAHARWGRGVAAARRTFNPLGGGSEGFDPIVDSERLSAPDAGNKGVWGRSRSRTTAPPSRQKGAEMVANRPRVTTEITTGPPPDLASVIEAWPSLPEPIRAAILALVKATTGR